MNGGVGKFARGFVWVFGVAAIWTAITVCIQLLSIAVLRTMESSGLVATPNWYDYSFPSSWMPWPAAIMSGLVVLVAAWVYFRVCIHVGGTSPRVLAGILVAAVTMVAWAILSAPSAVATVGLAEAYGWVRLSMVGALGSLVGSVLGAGLIAKRTVSERSVAGGA